MRRKSTKFANKIGLPSPLVEQHKEHTQTRDASFRDVAKSCKINNHRNSSIAHTDTEAMTKLWLHS
jgi:hypothetical protein